MNIALAVLASVLLGLLPACTKVAVFPKNGTPAIKEMSQFETMTANPEAYRGKAIRLAGRILHTRETDTETIILAKWIPFPDSKGDAVEGFPHDPHRGEHEHRFRVFYPGKLDGKAQWRGNEFLAIGKMEGNRHIVTMTGRSQEVPALKAECLRIWTTAGEVPTQYDPTGMDRNLPTAETYCHES